MLFTNELEEVVFNCHRHVATDEIIILSGYVGPSPIERLSTLPFRSTIIYGMYGSEGIRPILHTALKNIQERNPSGINIRYSNIPVHAKCYLWRQAGRITHALVGSANFSVNGLTTPFREVLSEIPSDTFGLLDGYVGDVLSKSSSCLDIRIEEVPIRVTPTRCLLSLLKQDGEIHAAAGLNWGQNPENHTTKNDAYIPIRIQDLRDFPKLFPPKQSHPIESESEGRFWHRDNDSIDILWDDGTTIRGLLEGSQEINGVKYPKQVSSFPNKSDLGIYFRRRLGVPSGQFITKEDLVRYGRTDVEVSQIGEGVYSFDFSKPNPTA